MEVLSANEAKAHFGDLLIKAQRAPVQINNNGKPVAVVVSAEDYESMDALKLGLLKARARQAEADMKAGNLVYGEVFFDEIQDGLHD